MYLLDVNILIALADADHVHHPRATQFFLDKKEEGWATCPITENGFLRIIGNPNYPKGPGSPQLAEALLSSLCSHGAHTFWPDDLTFRGATNLPGTKKLTDHYLLALAIQKEGRLATLDRRMNATILAGGLDAYHVIP